ncbi:MAG: hypothetical protein ACYDH4_11990 [Candidatus Cryosericum sp.]
MGARRHRIKHLETHPIALSAAGHRKVQPGVLPGTVVASPGDHSLDTFFDPAHVHLSSVMQRQSELATLAWHFALASVAVPVGGVVLGLLAVLFAREAQDMFDLVGGTAFDRRRAHKSLVIGGTMTAVWLIGTVVAIFVLASHGF